MNTTGNPEGGETDPGSAAGTPQTGPAGGEADRPGSPGDGEQLGDYGYTGGYGYGPGYGDPDGGGGYSYGQQYATPGIEYAGQPGPAYARPDDASGPGYGDVAQTYGDPAQAYGPPGSGPVQAAKWQGDAGGSTPGPAGAAGGPPASLQPPAPPVVAPTPALKGFPGGPGIDTLTGDRDGGRGRDPRGLSNPSVWQHAQQTWRDSGVEWQRPVSDYEPAEAEWERLQASAPAKRRAIGRSGPSGRRPRPGRGVLVTAVVIIVVAALAVGGVELFGGKKQHPVAAGPKYPPATPAGRLLTANPAQAGRNIFQTITAVSESAGTVVAAGVQAGQWLPRTEFLVSTNAGKTWQLAAVKTAAGTAAAAVAPTLIAHGRAGWLAIGSSTYWTSPDGKTWTQAPGTFPLQAGDQPAAVAATASGFIVVGDNIPHGDRAARNPVIWTSSNGTSWQRLSGSKLHLPIPGPGRLLRIRGVAVYGSDVLIYGNAVVTTTVTTTSGKGKHKHTKKHKVTGVNFELWQSGNGGSSWGLSHLPLGAGQSSSVAGIAATGSGFVAVRPATSKSAGPDAVAFTSTNGTTWTTGGTITASKAAHLAITAVSGSDQGAVVAGLESGRAHAVFVSTTGASWQSRAAVGSPTETLSGYTVAAGQTVIAGGYGPHGPTGQVPYLAVDAPGKPAAPVSFASIPGAAGPSMAVHGLAVAAGRQVAVGSANGYPAIWSASSGGDHWTPVNSPALAKPGLSTLNAVAHGGAGWVAVGGTSVAAPVRPVVLGSSNGTSWQAADGESAFSAPGITLHAAAAGPGGYVVAGQEVVPAKTTTKTVGKGKHKKKVKHTIPSRTDAVAWWSSGLTGWTQVLNTTGSSAFTINAVTADGSGFMAVGSDGDFPAVWKSQDGKTWALIQLGPPSGAAVSSLHQVGVFGHTIVATGMATSSKASAAKGGVSAFSEYSTDGGTLWQQVALTGPAAHPLPSPVMPTALAVARKGVVATGVAGPVGDQHVVVWWTTQGYSWKTIQPTGTGLTSPGSQAITALTASGSALTGSGYLVTATGEQPTLWHATAGP